ncbi:hypothetical protein GCM10023206_07200 [Acinetobacter puyangensis]|uniref:Uncharacterized protein n=1 Tax=Acinetobacter puyangensis TaxID=1096779 RepID=A0A240E8J6_9GAMM|nr:hypothetical protein [Acinetobacter puyangensis]SNX44200.1 hypothetical protein SAMN05421731_102361 [Acinetobacter puyangensis]
MKRKLKQRANQQRRQQRSIQAMMNKTHKTHCPHGFDIACLICGFGEQEDKRVWHHQYREVEVE